MRVPLAPEGRPFVLVPLLAGAGSALAGAVLAQPPLHALAAVLLMAAAFCAYFFRDPERFPEAGEGAVVAPADGRVTDAGATGAGLRVSIFLSLFDVHVNRAPIAGRVEAVRHRPGAFLAAYREDAAERNEQNELRLATEHGPVVVRQIAGVVARRIVCRARPGDRLGRAERFGLIRFGSRTDMVLPPGFALAVRRGDRVRGGQTVIARRREERSP